MRLPRLLLAASFIAAFSQPMVAQAPAPLQSVDGPASTVGDMVAELTRSHSGSRTKVVNIDTTNSSFLFPSAGSVQGAGGTFFKSDGMIVNHRNAMQRITMGWIAQGVNNASRPVVPFQLNAVTPYTLQDFVASSLHESGLGAVLVSGTLQSGNADSSALLDGFSRIWTNQPNASGTVSLAFPSIAVLDSFGNAFAYALGLRHDAGFRTNVGIVNLDTQAHTWTVTVNGQRGPLTNFNVTVEGISMRQVPIPTGDYGILLIALAPDVNGFWWSAYAASVDNITGDGWVAHAAQP
jgi:hypothetical protein